MKLFKRWTKSKTTKATEAGNLAINYSTNVTFKIAYTKLYAPVVTL